jgi:ribosomal protein L29
MAKDYSSMSKEELEKELRRLKDNLEDLEETLGYYYSATQAHIPGGFVRQDEAELKELKADIARVEELLKGK